MEEKLNTFVSYNYKWKICTEQVFNIIQNIGKLASYNFNPRDIREGYSISYCIKETVRQFVIIQMTFVIEKGRKHP